MAPARGRERARQRGTISDLIVAQQHCAAHGERRDQRKRVRHSHRVGHGDQRRQRDAAGRARCAGAAAQLVRGRREFGDARRVHRLHAQDHTARRAALATAAFALGWRFATVRAMTDTADVAANLAEVRRRIAAAEDNAGRAPGSVQLVAVAKTFGAERLEPALAAGQRHFGENRVQEAERKWPPLRERFADVRVHLIGPLQTNKVRAALAAFDVIETLDRPKLAHALAAEMAHGGRRLPCLLEVNLGEEPQKAGVGPDALAEFVALCRDQLQLPVAGLMCIPPADREPAPYFALLAKLAQRHGLAQCSMGMSADFEVAIAFGATIVRVGTAIFGAR